MQDVGQQKFLVLLLVMDAEFDERRELRRQRRIGGITQPPQRLIHVGAIVAHFVCRRPRDHAAIRAGCRSPSFS